MSKDKDREILHTRLESVIDRFGADASRWPADEQRDLLRFVSDNDEARSRLDEAEALDKLLAYAPAGKVSSSLKSRIMDEARLHSVDEGVVVSFPVGAERARSSTFGRGWQMSGLLAASLMFGIYLGASGQTDNSLQVLLGSSDQTTQSASEQEIELASYLPSLAFDGDVLQSEEFDE